MKVTAQPVQSHAIINLISNYINIGNKDWNKVTKPFFDGLRSTDAKVTIKNCKIYCQNGFLIIEGK